MTIREIENLIREIPRWEADIKDIDIRINDIEADISLKGISYEERPAPTNKIASETELRALNIIEKVDKLKAKRRKTELMLFRVKNALSSLSDYQRELVEMKYIKNLKYWEISESKGKSERQLKRIIKNALRKINEIIGIREN